MAEGKGGNVSDPNATLNGNGFLSMNPENSRALQMLTADDVLAMKFDSLAAAESFYNKYASAVGFVVRKDDTVRNKLGEVIMRRWVCNREGFQKRKHIDENVNLWWDPRPSTRVNCPAAFSVGRAGHKWLVREFVAEHMHQLAPACRSHLQIKPPMMTSENVKKKGLVAVEAWPIQVVDYLEKQFDCDRVGVRRQDLQASRAEITLDDVETLAYLRAKEAADAGILFCETEFVEGRLAYIFLADDLSQCDFACFGDVMAVCRTNSYDLHLVVLAGLNHHHQTTVFGCAILHEETVEAYSWLFQTLLEVTQGCMPITVVTDGHEALRKAIKLVLPRSRHRLCTWHLEKLARSNVKDPSFISNFKEFMLEVLSLDDFELKSKAMVDKYKLSENPWIHKMYEKRHEWAETYFRGHFWAGLRRTKVCGSIEEHLHRFSRLKRKPSQLIDQYQRAVLNVRCNEMMADYDSKSAKFALSTPLVKIEKHAADVFTRESYKRFLSEMRLETLLFVLEKDDGSTCRNYKLGKYGDQNLAYEVMFKPSGPSIKCSCLKFETLGYPCSHAIHIMKSEGLGEIPRSLIHPRWTKAAKATAQFWQRYLPPVSSDVFERMVRYGTMMSACYKLAFFGLKSDQAFKDVSNCFKKLIDEFESSDACGASNSGGALCMPANEKDDTSVTRTARSKGSFRVNEDKRRKTQGDGRSGNVEQAKHGYPKLINAVISVGDNRYDLMKQRGRFDQGRDLFTNTHVDH